MDFRFDDRPAPLPKQISTELLCQYVKLTFEESKNKAEVIKALQHGKQYLDYVIGTFQSFRKEKQL